MTRPTIRIREAELDECLARLLKANGGPALRFVAAVLPVDLRAPVARVERQTRHVGSSGSICQSRSKMGQFLGVIVPSWSR